MSICKTFVKELVTKLGLSPINRASTTTPKSRLIRGEVHRLSPLNLGRKSPQTPPKCSSPKQERLCSFASKEINVVASIGNKVNQICSPKHLSKESISPSNQGPEIDTPLREDLLRRPQQKRDLKILGRGAFGHVFFGHLKGRRVAVKISRKPVSNSVGECYGLHLEHPHIVRIFDIKENATHRLTIMEYAGSQNLQQILGNHKIEIPVATKFRYSWQIASAVDYCHQQDILHLDIKPANIVVSSTGCCKLGDFGCSQRMNFGGTVAQEFSLQGTVAYIAPEVLRGQNPTTASDTYSLGILFWQILTRHTPFQGQDPHAVIYRVVSMHLRPALPPTSDIQLQPYIILIQQCWDPCKNKRPALQHVLQDLRVHF